MDGAEIAVLARIAENLLALKLFFTSAHCLWVYDYFLTFGDEVEYAWCGKKSWIFALFIANRYTPVLYLVWINITLFDYGKSFCQSTKWISVFHTFAVTVLAQMTIALRIYAITGRNKLFGGLLLVLVSAQLCFGVYFVTKTAVSPAQAFPEINLDAFKICSFKHWRPGELLFTSLVMAFDLLAFSIIFATARRQVASRYPGIPSILNTVLRDATLYFVFVFVGQLLLELFLLFAPEEIRLLPGMVNTVFVPAMVSRLMLSLKKATIEPYMPWSLSTMSEFDGGTTPELVTVDFASRTLGRSHETSERPIPPNEGAIELGPMPRDRW